MGPRDGSGGIQVDMQVIAEITARLDLRAPNRDALVSIAAEVSNYYDVRGDAPPFEAVVVSATGVGKTYVLAAAIEYFAVAADTRNFAVVTPGRTILDKTVRNFTPGNAKSLLDSMSVRPVVITSDNFATPAARASMDNPDEVKLYIFTVQALTKPETQQGRRTHKFQEGLGGAFYEHLTGLSDLVVFADEHHCYYGPAFSSAIRNLHPHVLVGLTATPHKNTPAEEIIFRYPLAAAIADRLVKTPVLVGRKDDRTDPQTKLTDGARLLELKAEAMDAWSSHSGSRPVRPVMLVVAQTIDEANEYAEILRSDGFQGGQYTDAVLVVHSDAPDQALAELERVEEPDSPVRVIVSVGMLKEGWDVKNVYVIASMRSSVSDILTEQTLGRGLRLPFGAYTGIEILDTLEIVAHERYEDLLRRAGVLNDTLLDYRVRAVLRQNSGGHPAVVRETSEAFVPLVNPSGAGTAFGFPSRDGQDATVFNGTIFGVADVQDRTHDVSQEAANVQVVLKARQDLPAIRVPQLVMRSVQSRFSLLDITDLEAFRRLGRSLAVNPEDELRRTLVGAKVVTGQDGLKRTQLVTTTAADRIVSQASLLPFDDLIANLTETVLHADAVPARGDQRAAAGPLIEAFLEGLDGEAERILSAFSDRVAARLVQLVNQQQRRFAEKPSYDEVLSLVEFKPERLGRPETSTDRGGTFKPGVGYEGWRHSLHEQAWFDSRPERDMANLLDDASEVVCWARLQRGDLPILWTQASWYHPDFLAVERDRAHWVIEVKADNDMQAVDVQEKRAAAERWANHVSADPTVGVRWRYLLAAESDVETAKGSWTALKRLAAG